MGKKTKLLILFGLVLALNMIPVGYCFSTTYSDRTNDVPLAYVDITSLVIDNNQTYIQFRINLRGSLDTSHPIVINVYINPPRYSLSLIYSSIPVNIKFFDNANSTNNLFLSNQVGLSYYRVFNTNQTIEIGYRFKSAYHGTGFLDIAIGQTISVSLSVSQYRTMPQYTPGGPMYAPALIYSDYVPDPDSQVPTYTLQMPSKVANWLWIVIGIAIGAGVTVVVIFIVLRRRKQMKIGQPKTDSNKVAEILGRNCVDIDSPLVTNTIKSLKADNKNFDENGFKRKIEQSCREKSGIE